MNSQVTNISMIGVADIIEGMWRKIKRQENLIAYSEAALEMVNLGG